MPIRLDDLLADVAALDPEADVDAEVRVSAATAETDSTEKAVEFWGHFEEKAAARPAAAAQDTSIHSASSTSGAATRVA
jgi:hypothetical protein